MAERKLLVEVAGLVDAPVDQVWPLLRDSLEATETDGYTAAHQGGWWYRGEWSAEPAGTGTMIIHRVYNVARWLRWGVPLANRFFIGFREATSSGFEQGIAEVARRLGTGHRLVEVGQLAR